MGAVIIKFSQMNRSLPPTPVRSRVTDIEFPEHCMVREMFREHAVIERRRMEQIIPDPSGLFAASEQDGFC
jgi:hypothetical protein